MKFKAKKNKNFHQLTVGLRTQLCKECEKMGRRFCEVDGKPAFFHRWVENDKALLKFDVFAKKDYMQPTNLTFKEEGYAPAGTHVEIIRQTFALVEYDDGTVCKVEPEKVKFTDRRAE